jgi:hypothetical protein
MQQTGLRPAADLRRYQTKETTMDCVNFLTIDFGKDLVLSFSFDDGTKYGVEGFCIQRTPKLEFAISKEERGPSIDWTGDDRIILLRSYVFDRNSITLNTDNGIEQFDISKINDSEFTNMVRVLKKMNFDKAFELTDNQ